jgi:hypothetical protein
VKPTLQDKLVKMRDSAKGLHEETDALNALYKQIEEFFQGVGVTFWWDEVKFDLRAGSDEECGAYVIVGYAKLSDQWCLATKWYVQRASETAKIEAFDPVPLTRAPRNVRVEFASRIEDFVDALVVKIARLRGDVDDAKAAIAQCLRHVK